MWRNDLHEAPPLDAPLRLSLPLSLVLSQEVAGRKGRRKEGMRVELGDKIEVSAKEGE